MPAGGVELYIKDYITTLPTQNGDRKDKSISDTSSTTGYISHTLTFSIPITDFTYKAILKELVQLLVIT